jgi:hypothetical protein
MSDAPRSTTEVLRLPDALATGGTIELSPFDVANTGRSIPLVWFYKETLDTSALLESLRQTLHDFPVFCGRYAPPTPATVRRIQLNNAGVPVTIAVLPPEHTLEAAAAHVTGTEASYVSRSAHDAYVPAKEPMDPDKVSPEAPLLAVKISSFSSGGSAIGLLAQHGVIDADGQIAFVRAWSQRFRGVAFDPPPIHDRGMVNRLATAVGLRVTVGAAGDAKLAVVTASDLRQSPAGDATADADTLVASKPSGLHVSVGAASEAPKPPAFFALMPKIGGASVCVVPLPAALLAQMKCAASAALSGGGAEPPFVSTDDVVTARVWKALCAMRCTQVGLASDSGEVATCMRPCNFRTRTTPPLGAGYFANAVTAVRSALPVCALLSMSVGEVAKQLRADLVHDITNESIAARAAWLRRVCLAGCTTAQTFDAQALTCIVSSWRFDWEAANFHATPVGLDHGAHVPIVSVITPRPGGDGLNVYASGTQESLEQFARLLVD